MWSLILAGTDWEDPGRRKWWDEGKPTDLENFLLEALPVIICGVLLLLLGLFLKRRNVMDAAERTCAMFTRRRWLMWLALGLALLIGVGAFHLIAGNGDPSEVYFAKVRVGMNHIEAETAMGRKCDSEYVPNVHLGLTSRIWYEPEGFLAVGFGKDDRIYSLNYNGRLPPPSFLDRLRAWLGW
jgi:hypothetical protein